MKMICPHCGVKGSADDSLLATKVKCPKCHGLFKITSEIIEPIPIGEFELEQIDDTPQADFGRDDIAGEVDEAFLDIFGEEFEGEFGQKEAVSTETADEEDDEEESELLKLLNQEFDDEPEGGLVAALSDIDDDESDDELVAAFSELDDEFEPEGEFAATLAGVDVDEPDDEFAAALASLDDDEPEDELVDALADIDDDEPEDELVDALADIDDDESEDELVATLADIDDDESEDELVATLADINDDDGAKDGNDDDEASLEDWAQSSAALTDIDDDGFADEHEYDEMEHDDDDTLTVIEDIPIEADNLGEDEQAEMEISLDDSDTLAMSDDDWQIDDDTEEESDVAAGIDEDDSENADSAAVEDGIEDGEMSDDESIHEDVALAGSEKNLYTETIQKCSACGKYVNPVAKHERGESVYCTKCVPADDADDADDTDEDSEEAAVDSAAASVAPIAGRFSIGTLIKDSWRFCKGVKGSIWAALFVMYFILFGIAAAGIFLIPEFPATGGSKAPMFVDAGIQVFAGFLSYIFIAGLILIAVNRVGEKPYSWKMVFSGFKKLGTLILAIILQAILLIVGFLLFILPGIYLSVGYMLVFPLIMDKGLSPWQAMEASRKAIHSRWWTVFFAFILMSIISTLSAIPAGIGLIWTVPMFFVMIGILYYHFFGGEE